RDETHERKRAFLSIHRGNHGQHGAGAEHNRAHDAAAGFPDAERSLGETVEYAAERAAVRSWHRVHAGTSKERLGRVSPYPSHLAPARIADNSSKQRNSFWHGPLRLLYELGEPSDGEGGSVAGAGHAGRLPLDWRVPRSGKRPDLMAATDGRRVWPPFLFPPGG